MRGWLFGASEWTGRSDDELVGYLRRCNEADNQRYAEVAGLFGAEALLDSHLPMPDRA
jgi:hypothetical protein